jgi:hypothetical protein
VLAAVRASLLAPKRLLAPHGEERGTRVSNHEGPDISLATILRDARFAGSSVPC